MIVLINAIGFLLHFLKGTSNSAEISISQPCMVTGCAALCLKDFIC